LTTVLEPSDLITEIRLPLWPASRRWGFEEFARRRGDFALAGIGLYFDEKENKIENAHVCAFGLGDCAQRISDAEMMLNGKNPDAGLAEHLAHVVSASVEPQEDIHASAEYRKALAGTMSERAYLSALRR
jgi:carbon-monoxide dehydrogenase medium subunit